MGLFDGKPKPKEFWTTLDSRRYGEHYNDITTLAREVPGGVIMLVLEAGSYKRPVHMFLAGVKMGDLVEKDRTTTV